MQRSFNLVVLLGVLFKASGSNTSKFFLLWYYIKKIKKKRILQRGSCYSVLPHELVKKKKTFKDASLHLSSTVQSVNSTGVEIYHNKLPRSLMFAFSNNMALL